MHIHAGRWLFCSLLVALALGCASTVELQPIAPTAPQQQAQRIYEAILAREGRTVRREPGTLSGFAEAPLKIVRQLEALAASRRGQERPVLIDLSEALASTGQYCKARFEVLEKGVEIKYKLLSRTRPMSAHAGWNILPVGIYEIWGERDGKRVSDVKEYEFLQREILIVVPGVKRRSP